MPRLTTSLRLFALASFALVAVSSAACHRVVVDEVHGPDGNTHWKRLSCRHMDKRCYREAAQLCPNGYYFAKGVSPKVAEHDTSDDAMESAAKKQPAAPAPQVGVNAKVLPPQETWGSGMYSEKAGTILVHCAGETTTASR